MCSAMRAALSFLLLPLCSLPAQAMNWEGHDDWMADMEPAVLYESTVPHAVPPQDETCTDAPRDKAEDNPYEQIELDPHRCAQAPPPPRR